jgi:hypothetical protein
MRKLWLLLLTSLAAYALGVRPSLAAEATVGVNVVNLQKLDVSQQDAILNDLKAAGVTVIRTGIAPDDNGIDFAKRAFARGIRIDFIVGVQYRPDAPTRPWLPKEFPNDWSGHPLSYADPQQFRAYFQALLDKLDAAGVRLAAFELGNELNSAAFNAEFPLPGQGKMFGSQDLAHDPEGRQIAAGYLQYLKVLAALRDIRSHSKVNDKTPVLTAGLAVYEGPDGPIKGAKTDSVSVNATLDFLRANGVDKLVDAYAVHVYPWSSRPGDASAAAARRDRLAKYALAKCHPAGSADGKPCWITEWGFKNSSSSCPTNDTTQSKLIEEMRDDFTPYVRRKELLGLIYYAWIDDVEHYGVFRCGALTNSGRLAIRPM